jgi:hypothetical protein
MGLRSPVFFQKIFCYEVFAKQKKYRRDGLYYFRTGDTIRTLPYLKGLIFVVKVKCKNKGGTKTKKAFLQTLWSGRALKLCVVGWGGGVV